MFKKGVITDEISQDFQVAAELAMKYNLDALEIRSVWEKGPHELNEEDIDKIDKIARNSGLIIPAISSPFFKCDIDNTDEIKTHMNILEKSINLAQKVGAKYIRGFTFWSKGGFEENLDKIISKFEEPLKILEREDLTLVLEFDPSVFATNAAKLAKVICGIGSERVKGLWDPGNDIYEPDGEVPYPDGYKIIKPYMVHMHLKDAVKLPDGKITGVPIGEGQVDYRGHFKRLIEDGYEGYIMLETHYRPRHDISEELMALPKGSAFSYMGYEATEECLIKWKRLLETIV
jgi:sugar phosphate isomerase/epimerase